jgi:hypothetical protein
MRSFAAVAALLATLPLAAQQADLEAVSVTLDKLTVTMGEPFSYTARVRNNGPSEARNAVVHVNAHSGAFPLSVESPPGWTCSRSMSDKPGAKCTTTALAAGAEVEFRGTALAPRNTAAWAMTLFAQVSAASSDPRGDNNESSARFTLVESPRVADLGVSVAQRGAAREGERVVIDVTVANAGPSAVEHVAVAVDTRGEEKLTGLAGSGDGWTCAASLEGLLCRTNGLAQSAQSAIEVSFAAPSHEADIDVAASVQAESSRDPNFRNDIGAVTAGVGSAENWRRILLPLAREFTPGANGAQWRTVTTMLIRSTQPVDIQPGPCDRIIDPCLPLPLGATFNAGQLIYTAGPGGQFLYVRPEDEAKLVFNTRIRDEARMTETAGAEIPVVREDEFRTDAISLVGIPVAPEYRHTLRVYDSDARSGARVQIRVYAAGEGTPLASAVRTLERSPESFPVTSARLPTHPSYLELRLDELIPLSGLHEVRVDIEPIDPGLRFWAFVSITNNETHHVTTVTPQ